MGSSSDNESLCSVISNADSMKDGQCDNDEEINFQNIPESYLRSGLSAYDEFMKWRTEHNIDSWSESVFLAYFTELSQKLKSPTLWSVYYNLRAIMTPKQNIDMKTFTELNSFLKKQSIGYKSKSKITKTLTYEQIEKYLKEAPDEYHLDVKVGLIIGITGGCTSQDLVRLTVDNLERQGQLLLLKLKNRKRTMDEIYIIRQDFTKYVDKYTALRPNDCETRRFFVNYQKGKCSKQPIGKNKVASFPKKVASFLKLSKPELYTGHCFRRTWALFYSSVPKYKKRPSETKIPQSVQTGEITIERCDDDDEFVNETVNNVIEFKNFPPTASEIAAFLNADATLNEDDPGIKQERPDTPNSQTSRIFAQNMTQTINIPKKSLTLSFTNCSNITINFTK